MEQSTTTYEGTASGPTPDGGQPAREAADEARNRAQDARADVDVTDASMADLVQRLSQQTATLVRQEMRLAQAELKQKGKRAGIGAGLLGAAGVIGLAALGAFVAALILVVGKAVDMWISAFIVTGGLAVVAAIVAMAGKKQVSEAVPPKPEATLESVQADVAEIKERARR